MPNTHVTTFCLNIHVHVHVLDGFGNFFLFTFGDQLQSSQHTAVIIIAPDPDYWKGKVKYMYLLILVRKDPLEIIIYHYLSSSVVKQ